MNDDDDMPPNHGTDQAPPRVIVVGSLVRPGLSPVARLLMGMGLLFNPPLVRRATNDAPDPSLLQHALGLPDLPLSTPDSRDHQPSSRSLRHHYAPIVERMGGNPSILGVEGEPYQPSPAVPKDQRNKSKAERRAARRKKRARGLR